MKRIAYAEAIVGTDARIAELVLEYATLLARAGQADTVVIPAVQGSGGLQHVSMLLGPASQITVFEDDEPFAGDAREAVADLERRVRTMTTSIATTPDEGPVGLDDLDDLGGVQPPR